MKNFFKKIKYLQLSILERFLSKKLQPHMQKSFSDSSKKTVLAGAETLILQSESKNKITQTRNNVADISKSCNMNPQKLLEYIEAKGTKIIRTKNAVKLLGKIGENEGLITELQGAKAFFINICFLKKFSLHTQPMFIMGTGEIEYYYLLREFYKWYSLNMGLGGFNFSAQENFKKYMININHPHFKSMNYKQMLELKEAIARDSEANEFVIELLKEKDGSENIFKKLSSGGGTI